MNDPVRLFVTHLSSGAIDTDRGNVHAKDQGQKSRSQRSKQILPQFEHVRTVTPVWIYIWQPNDAQSLKWHRKCALLFLAVTKQLYEWFSPSVCLSVCLYVRTSVRTSHLFDYAPIIVSSWNFQELLPMTEVTSMQKVKVRGQRSRSQVNTPLNRFRTVTPVWIHHWLRNDAKSLK